MLQVVVITPYFWPEVAANVPLVTALCEDMVRAGHQVTVVTSFPHRGVDRQTLAHFRKNRVLPEYYRGALVLRFPNPFSRWRWVPAKILEYVLFSFWSVAAAVFLRRVDAFFVYSNPPLLGLPVSLIGRLRRIPVVYNLQDLFPDSAVASGILQKDGYLTELLRRLELLTYRKATVIAAIGQHFATHVSRLAPGTRIEVIPNWVDVQALSYVPPEQNRFLAKTELRGKFIVLYAGNIGFLQNLDIVIEAAGLLKQNHEIVFVIVGEGPYKKALVDKVNMLALSNVAFYPFQPEDLVAHVYSTADIGLVTVRRGGSYCSIPSKAWVILACGRPLLACVDEDSELAGLIMSEEIGRVVGPDDPHALAREIQFLYERKTVRDNLASKGRSYVERNLNRDSITARYIALIEDVCKGRRDPTSHLSQDRS